ncbi:MAG: lysostaphin resistance A-like protein [Acidobacteriota bacterium]
MKRAFGVIAGLVITLTVLGGYYVHDVGGKTFSSLGVLVAFALLMIPYFALGFDQIVDALRAIGRSSRIRLLSMGFLLLVPGIVVLVSEGGRFSMRNMENMGILVLYVAVPIVLLSGWGRQTGPRPSMIDLVTLLLLWLPVEMKAFAHLWSVPAGNPSYVLAKALAMELALFCFVVVRRLEGVGYRFRLCAADMTVGTIALSAFLVFAVPAALGTGFVSFQPHWNGMGRWLLMSLGIFFFIALPEEVLFRGLIFNMLQRMIKVGGPYAALVISSFIFGLAHLNNPPGDWRYVLLGTMAGISYGWAYLRTGSLLSSAYTHAMVDIIARTLFGKGSA